MRRPQFIYIYESHLDLFWIGDYRYCLERGRHVIKQYIDRCVEHPDESFLLETVVFLEHFLKKHPEYKDVVKDLWAQGRLDIGAAYVDILEHLVLGESQIRNIVRGKSWCRAHLDIDTRLAAHADLPSLIPQVAQIYRKAGTDYYSTSRKVFPNGQVWVHVAPDGTKIRVFNHPFHYDFHELRPDAGALNVGRGWDKYLDPSEALKGFPLGKVVLSAGAADQADMDCFERRHGKSAREFVEEYRATYPEIEFSFGTVSAMMKEYDGCEEDLPHLSGEIPSVWGMTSVPSTFFQTGRRLEGQLLTAEFLAALQHWYGLRPIAEVRDEWFGTLYERLYFLGKDPIPRGLELDQLWKMHIFICDHNFSGNFASQTAFDKRTIQERALSYTEQMVGHGLACLAGAAAAEPRVLVLNPLNWARAEPLEVDLPADLVHEDLCFRDERGAPVRWQGLDEPNPSGQMARLVLLPTVPSAGYATMAIENDGNRHSAGPLVDDDGDEIGVRGDAVHLVVDRCTGAIRSLRDMSTGADWGSEIVGKLYAVHEEKSDVPLGVDETKVLAEEVVDSVQLSAAGPLFARIMITKSILKAHVTQEITVWQAPVDAVDVKTTILWHGQRRVQMRQCLPTAEAKEDVFYGTPFYGNNWLNVVPGSGPRNPDEMACRDHWNDYRELQLWVHQRRKDGALAMSSLHATYHWGRSGLEAVLMRTTPSGADDRFFWEHAGKREFSFRFRFADADASLSRAARMGQEAMCPLVGRVMDGKGLAALPPGTSFVTLDNEDLILSTVHPDTGGEGIIVRFFETAGTPQKAKLRIEGAGNIERVNFLEERIGPLSLTNGVATLDVGPYEIVTLRVTK